MILAERELPKINGSSGGFIAIVVCLSVLVVGLFAAVFILLRDHEPTDEDRAVRRQLSRRRREQQDSSSPFTYTSSSTTPLTLTQKIGRMFGTGATTDQNNGGKKTKNRSKSGQGWVQASGDEWEIGIDGENEVQTRSLSSQQTPRDIGEFQGIRLADRSIARDGGSVNFPFQPPQPPYTQSNSTSSVQNLYNPYTASSTPPPLRTPVTRLQTTDSVSPSSPSIISASSAARALSGSPEPYATGSIDDLRPKGERQFSTQSGASISTRTSHTGTKFIESLE